MKKERPKISRFLLGVVITVVMALLLPVQSGRAQIVTPPLRVPSIVHLAHEPLIIQKYFVDIEIDNQLARIRVEQTLYNPNDRVIEGSYLFPIPKGAAVSELTLCSEGKCIEGELLEAEEARRIYHDIVRKTRDPALLEYVGDKAFRVRLFPIPAKGERRIKLSYQQLLERSGNLVELVHPLIKTESIKQFAINVAIREDEPIGNIYSPSHKISIQKISDTEARISFEATDLKPDQDFVLYYSLTQRDLGVDLLTYREKGEDGYFALLISPALEEQEILPKDIVFVFDISGSMDGKKIEQAKESLKYAIGNLNEGDRFGLVVFNDVVRDFREGLIPVQSPSLKAAHQFIDKLEASGSTDINSALLRGLEYFEAGPRLKLMVFLTDGLPTFGERDPAAIIRNVGEKNILGVRLFVFGVGYDVNTKLLDRLSRENGGFSTYIEPGESIEQKVSGFYDRVGSPLLADLELDFGELKVYDLYPKKLPDLFKGSQLQVLGRYSTSGEGRVILRARRGEEAVEMEFEVDFPKEDRRYSFLPRIWAARKIGYLLEQIRLYGEDQELVGTVKQLATKYGIATPYTSYFAGPEDEMKVTTIDPLAFDSTTGYSAVKAAQMVRSLKEEARITVSANVRQVQGRTFILKDGVWTPTDYSGGETIKVEFGSEAYFWLADNSLADYLALGKRAILSWQGNFIEVTEAEGIADAEDLKQLGADSAVLPGRGSPSQPPMTGEDATSPEESQKDKGAPSDLGIDDGTIIIAIVTILLMAVIAGFAFPGKTFH